MGSAAVRVQLLGPVRAWSGDEEVALRGVTGRSVLARLALDGGTAVGVDALTESLWDDGPPARPAANVHTAVSRLRRVLGGETIETSGSGYLLSAGVTVDVDELEAVVQTADPDPAGVARALDEQIARWGGMPLDDVADTWVFEPYRAKLSELQLEAYDLRDACEIEVGRATAVLPDLWRRVELTPLRERTRLLLADALSRVGRSTEALRVLDEFRRSLVDLSGADPSSELLALERCILVDSTPRRDRGPLAHRASDASLGPKLLGVPDNLPSPASRFVGRRRELERVGDLIRQHRLVTLTGVGGSGKTRLAIEAAAAALRSELLVGVVFVDLLPVSPDRVADAIVDAAGLQVGVAPGSTRSNAIARFVARRNLLVVLDNCEHVMDAVAGLAHRIVSSGPEARVLATSRVALGVDGERVFRLQGLGQSDLGDEAKELLFDRARARDDGLVLDDESAASDLCRRLDGLPMAIELAAAQLDHLSVEDLLVRLDRRLDLPPGGRSWDGRSPTLQSMMDWSWELLQPVDRDMLAALSVFPGSFEMAAVEAVCVVLPEPPADVLRRLVASSLVEVRRSGRDVRYQLLETVRVFAARQLEDAGATDAVNRRHRAWLIEWIEGASFGQHSFSSKWIAAYAALLDDLFAAVNWSIAQDDWESAGQLLAAGSGAWRSGCRSVSAIELLRLVLTHEMEPALRVQVLQAGSDAALAAGQHALMIELGEEALGLAREIADAELTSIAATWNGIFHMFSDRPRSLELVSAANALANDELLSSWTSSAMLLADHLTNLGEPMRLDEVWTWPAESVAHGGVRCVAAVNDAFGQRRDEALKWVDWLRDHGPHAAPIQNTADAVLALVEALAGDPEDALALVPLVLKRLERTTETVWRAELLLAIAVARFRLGDADHALRYLERLSKAAMNHPVFFEVRSRYAQMARAAIGDRDRIAEIRLAARSVDIDQALIDEVSPPR